MTEITCPSCGHAHHMELRSLIPEKSRFSMRLVPDTPRPFPASVVGDLLVNSQQLMNACSEEHGVRTTTFVERIEHEESGAINFHFMIMPNSPTDEASQIVRAQADVARFAARLSRFLKELAYDPVRCDEYRRDLDDALQRLARVRGDAPQAKA